MWFANMASLMGVLAFAFVSLSASMSNSGGGLVGADRVFKVGDELGWQEPGANNSQVYSLWATMNRFHVGDSLYFVYQNDSVIEVDKWGYYHCNASYAIVAFNNGNSTFKLDRPGPFYYISGNLQHCIKGQRLLVEVMGHHNHRPHHHSPPPYISPPPESYQAPSPQPSSGGEEVSVPLVISLVSAVLVSAAFY